MLEPLESPRAAEAARILAQIEAELAVRTTGVPTADYLPDLSADQAG
jgi:hypothetical protein